MLKSGILNPQINSLLARVRHTNLLVIADRGFPYWPQVETVDISLTDDIPTVVDVVRAIRDNFVIAQTWMAQEFLQQNEEKVQTKFSEALRGVPINFLAHNDLKLRVPQAIGLIRTGDSIQYANVIVQSG